MTQLLAKQFQKSRFLQFSWFLVQRIMALDITRVSSSLTFTTLLAMVPFFTITLIVISAFPMFSNLTEGFNNFISNTLMPDASAKVIGEYVYSFRDKASNLTAIGIIALAISAILLIMTIEKTFNQIWNVTTQRPLLNRLLMYWAILTLGPVAIGLVSSTWALMFKESNFAFYYPVAAAAVHITFSVVFSTAVLILLFRCVPAAYVPLKHAALGALITAAVLEIARRAFGYYMSNFNSYELIYGAFATIPVFLLWVNMLWAILILGAVLTASMSYWQGSVFLRKNNTADVIEDVIGILVLLHHAQNNKRGISIQAFRTKIQLGYDELGDLLERLVKLNYIEDSPSGWILKTNAANINIRDLFSVFVYQPMATDDNQINQHLKQLMQPSLEKLNICLDQFIEDSKLENLSVAPSKKQLRKEQLFSDI